MDNQDNDRWARYQVAIQLLSHEGDIYWQTFGAFLLAHTVLVGFMLQSLNPSVLIEWRSGGFITSTLGLILCAPWLTSLMRARAYYALRMTQAKMAEPVNWKLVAEDGEAFAEGHAVVVGRMRLRMPRLARFRVTSSLAFLIVLFAIAYLTVVIISGPWWGKGSSSVVKPASRAQLTSEETIDAQSFINWRAVAALATLSAVLVALLPIRREARRRKSQARSLRLRLSSKLTVLRPSLGKVIRGTMSHPAALLTKEDFREVVHVIALMMNESACLEHDEQDQLGLALANLEVAALIYGTDELHPESAKNTLDLIDRVVAVMGEYGLLHGKVDKPWDEK